MNHTPDAAGPAEATSPRDRWVLAGILVLAALLRLYKIGQQSLWTDEVMSIAMVTQVESGMMYFLHGPLHSVLLQFWSIWYGMADAWTRCLSAAIGVATIPFVYVLTRRLAGGQVALLGALLLAISPFHVWYSQEVRNYALLIGMTAAAQLLFLRVLEGPTTWKHWLGVGLMSMGLVLTNLAGAFLIAAQGAYLLFARRRLLAPFVAVNVVAMLLLLPWWLHAQSVANEGAGLVAGGTLRHTNFHPLALPFALSVYSVGFTVGPSLNEMNRSLSMELLRPHLWYFVPVALIYGALFLRGWWRLRGQVGGKLFFFLWLLVPLGITALLAIANIKVFNPRYAAVAFPAYVLILAHGLQGLRRPIQVAALALVILASGYSLWNHYENPRYWKPDARSAAAYVNERFEAGDCVIIYTLEKPFRRYFEGEAELDRVPWAAPTSPERLQAYLEPRLRECSRIWLVNYRGWYLDPDRLIEAELGRRWRRLEDRSFVGMDVALFAAPEKAQGAVPGAAAENAPGAAPGTAPGSPPGTN